MPAREKPAGPTGLRVAFNVAELRRARRLTTAELSDELARLGQPIPVTGVTKLEKGMRRVDVDDLMALAFALGVSPLQLLLPTYDPGGDVQLTSARAYPWRKAWRWTTESLPRDAAAVDPIPDEVLEELAESRLFDVLDAAVDRGATADQMCDLVRQYYGKRHLDAMRDRHRPSRTGAEVGNG